MNWIPAIRVTVLHIHVTAKELKAGEHEAKPAWHNRLEQVIGHLTVEEYLAQQVQIFPAGATIYLAAPCLGVPHISLPAHDPVIKDFPVFVFHDRRYFLLFTDAISGTVAHSYYGESEDLHGPLRRRCDSYGTEYGTVYSLDLGNEGYGVLNIGEITVVFRTEHPFSELSVDHLLEKAIPPISRDKLIELRRERDLKAAVAAQAKKDTDATQRAEETASRSLDAVFREEAAAAGVDAPPQGPGSTPDFGGE
jgi:hypothetical protein